MFRQTGGQLVVTDANTADGREGMDILTGVRTLYFLDGVVKFGLGGECRVNTYVTSEQYQAAVASLSDGGFVVTWTSLGQDGSSSGVYGQRYDAFGNALGNEFKVNTNVTDIQAWPSVAALADGGFAVTWQSYGQDGSGYGIYGQRYDALGNLAGGEFRINTRAGRTNWCFPRAPSPRSARGDDSTPETCASSPPSVP